MSSRKIYKKYFIDMVFNKIQFYKNISVVLVELYRVVGNWWYKRKGGGSTRKRNRKYRIKLFRLRLCFRENRL